VSGDDVGVLFQRGFQLIPRINPMPREVIEWQTGNVHDCLA
jgi:hypothetical protein